jgi:hypothetical protein
MGLRDEFMSNLFSIKHYWVKILYGGHNIDLSLNLTPRTISEFLFLLHHIYGQSFANAEKHK